MKKRTLFTAVLLSCGLLAGCNGDDENVTDVPENAPVEQNTTTNQEDTTQTEDQAFNFTHFDLDVEYSGNQEYDVDYENERNGMEAEIKDERTNTQSKGDEAFATLQPIFENLTFDQLTTEDEVISEVMSAFNLGEDFEKFELEVRFSDGTQKEYKQRP
ncbi:YusW family protein [Bacillus sp. PS06]|uniref:YusW family protein n=1 Tax=Bacillus sp. PS06 TaxID=2764176 RepID=UPI00177EC151|nr:YusW family protein [Bacillus sp. PS06]MBD8069456.1 hypothetical protein [Bacillus sp. PS06]